MAEFKMDGLDDFMKQMSAICTDVEDIAKQCVNEAAPQLESAMRSAVSSAANRGYATGATAASPKAGKAKVNDLGVYCTVTFKGTDARGTRNAEKAAFLEYGTSRQAAHPFMRSAISSAEGSVQSLLESRFSEQINKYTNE